MSQNIQLKIHPKMLIGLKGIIVGGISIEDFSVVTKLNVNDSKIIFNRDVWPMFPIPVVKPNSYNASQAGFVPEKGMLLVFKSDTMHMVEKKVTDDMRISFSYNFISS